MSEHFIQGKTFENLDFSKQLLEAEEYEDCQFIRCNFMQVDLSNILFSKSRFIECDLSLAILTKASFRAVSFIQCKMLGMQFDACNPFLLSFKFDQCVLNFSSFYNLKIKKTVFDNCKLEEVDFIQADLSNAIFHQSDLSRAKFEQTKLQGADFRQAMNYSIDPDINTIKGAKFSREGLGGLLEKYGIEVE